MNLVPRHGRCFMQVASEGETYYRYGVMLKKVANFYNNMASQVLVNRSNTVEYQTFPVRSFRIVSYPSRITSLSNGPNLLAPA